VNYLFHHFASGNKTEVPKKNAEWMVGKAWGAREGLKRLARLDAGEFEYLSVTGGQIKCIIPIDRELAMGSVK